MELKDKLKKLRKERGLTQSQLADAIFVSRSTDERIFSLAAFDLTDVSVIAVYRYCVCRNHS